MERYKSLFKECFVVETRQIGDCVRSSIGRHSARYKTVSNAGEGSHVVEPITFRAQHYTAVNRSKLTRRRSCRCTYQTT